MGWSRLFVDNFVLPVAKEYVAEPAKRIAAEAIESGKALTNNAYNYLYPDTKKKTSSKENYKKIINDIRKNIESRCAEIIVLISFKMAIAELLHVLGREHTAMSQSYFQFRFRKAMIDNCHDRNVLNALIIAKDLDDLKFIAQIHLNKSDVLERAEDVTELLTLITDVDNANTRQVTFQKRLIML